MKILITGASGLIGTALQKSFKENGYEMILAGRKPSTEPDYITWDSEKGFAADDLKKLEGLDAIIHLAGEPIGDWRWTDDKKKRIRDSRVNGTRTIIEAISKLKTKPKALLSMSGVGYYGDRGDEILNERGGVGDTFLAEICRDWEAEARKAENYGVRVVLMRNGVVLSKDGGALATMMTPFSLGLGGVAGSGKQWLSWLSLDDMVGVTNFVLENESIEGAVNVVSPNPVTNEEFTKTLGEAIHRPTFLPLPQFAVNLIMGEMGDALLLDSARAVPKKLEDAGYEFKYPLLKPALDNAVK
jgi:uncharacterized protein (TIGR01777 family)